jgi:hypothetical protein
LFWLQLLSVGCQAWPDRLTVGLSLLHFPVLYAQISGLVCERDSGLRLSLANMGMRQAPYWVSWMAYDMLLTFGTALLMVCFGELTLPGSH